MKKIGAVLLVCLLFFSGCSSKSKNELIIVDGRLSEQKVVLRMVKYLVEAQSDLKVTIKAEMSAVNGYTEMKKKVYDMMMSYDGTVLTTFLKLDPKDVPEGQTLYDFTNEKVQEANNMMMLDKLGLDNTYAVAVPQSVANDFNLKTVSDLKPVAGELIFGGEHEFFTEDGTIKYTPFTQVYGLKFKDYKSVDLGLKYSAIESRNIDVTVAYATDGLNKKNNLKILEDDLQFFPEYNGALLVQSDLFERFKDSAPELKSILSQLGNIFTNESMTDLSYAIDVEGKDVDQVAKDFLIEKGLLK